MAFTSFSPNLGYANLSTLAYPTTVPTAVVVTSGTTPVQSTVAQMLSGFLIVDCQDTGTLTMPTAALLAAGIEGCQVNTSFRLLIKNSGDTVLTLAASTGGTVTGTATVTNAYVREFLFVFTNVTPGSEAVTAFALATGTY